MSRLPVLKVNSVTSIYRGQDVVVPSVKSMVKSNN